MSGQLYQSYYLPISPPEFYERLQNGAGLLLQQYGLPGVALGLIGLIMFRMPPRLYVLSIWLTVARTAAALWGDESVLKKKREYL